MPIARTLSGDWVDKYVFCQCNGDLKFVVISYNRLFQGYKCLDCRVIVHKKCSRLLPQSCEEIRSVSHWCIQESCTERLIHNMPYVFMKDH